MYSVVLMMALTGGAEAPDLGHRNAGCCGCYGSAPVATGCYGCSGVISNGCCGCQGTRHGLFGRHRNNGCNGCYGGCNGGCYGGCVGVVSYGCTGGCYGGAGGYYGAPGVVPPGTKPAPIPMPPVKEKEKDKKPIEDEVAAPATILVSLPADAVLVVDGYQTKSTSDVRTFVTPSLPTGSEYGYNLTATVVRGGQTLTQTQRVTVRAGQSTNVPFTFAGSQAVTSR